MKLNHGNRIILDEKIYFSEIDALLNQPGLSSESKTLLPQADDFNKLIEILDYMGDEPINSNQIAFHVGFSKRQADYYLTALVYLDLIQKYEKGIYKATRLGMDITVLPSKEKCLRFAAQILLHPMFRAFFKECRSRQLIGTKADIVSILKKNGYPVEGSSTLHRRASTIRCWTIWIVSLACDVKMPSAPFSTFIVV